MSQAYFCRRQEVRVLLRWRPAFGPCCADSAAYGAKTGRSYRGRIWRVEKGRRAGGSGRVRSGKKVTTICRPAWADQKILLVVFSSLPQLARKRRSAHGADVNHWQQKLFFLVLSTLDCHESRGDSLR